jgi:hypothetical protein
VATAGEDDGGRRHWAYGHAYVPPRSMLGREVTMAVAQPDGPVGPAHPWARLLMPVLAAAGAVAVTVVVRALADSRPGDPRVRQVEDQAAWAGFVLPDGFALPARGDLPVRLTASGRAEAGRAAAERATEPEEGVIRVAAGTATLLVRRDGVLVPVTALG